MLFYRRNIVTISKLACAVFVVLFYILYSQIDTPVPWLPQREQGLLPKPPLQFEEWTNTTGKADTEKLKMIAQVMRDAYDTYNKVAWGHDEIKPVTGGTRRSRNGWGAFIVDTSTTLVVMKMWTELQHSVDFIVNNIDFNTPVGLVDPFETTIRYLGALVSLLDLYDAGVIPAGTLKTSHRAGLVKQATILANNLLPAYDTATGLPWPNVNFNRHQGTLLDPSNSDPDVNPTVNPARAGSNILENCALSKITSEPKYCEYALKSWRSLVWSKWEESPAGLINSPIDIIYGNPVSREKGWDRGHDSYYEYLLKATIAFPSSPFNPVYSIRWMEAAHSLRWNLTTRSAPSEHHNMSHLFMGKLLDNWYLNEQSHLSCFAAGTLFLGAKHLLLPSLLPLAKSLLEGCRHVYSSTPTGLGPEVWSWDISQTTSSMQRWNQTFFPQTAQQVEQLANHGFWVVDPRYRLRPEYVESLFYAYRVTGEERYRDWAWQAFTAMQDHCRTQWSYAGVADVMEEPRNIVVDEDNVNASTKKNDKKGKGGDGGESNSAEVEEETPNWIDEQESFWSAETLKYMYLIFEDVEFYKLDNWVFTTEGHLVKRRE